jgi:hypothetical protein
VRSEEACLGAMDEKDEERGEEEEEETGPRWVFSPSRLSVLTKISESSFPRLKC